MTSRLLPLLLLFLLAIIIIISATDATEIQENPTKQQPQLWKSNSNNNNNNNDVTKAEARSDSRQHKAFFVNYPVMQRVYKDAADLEASESRKRHKQRLRKPAKKPESEIYFIKLPPAPYSYVEGLGYISQPPVFNPASLPKPKPKPKPKPFVKLPIDFVSNGKPTKVYQYPPYKVDTPVIRLNRGPYNFNGNPTGIYVIKNNKRKKTKRKPILTNEYKKKVVVKQ